MNKVIEMGRLVRDPEIRYGNNNNAVANFTIAVDRRFKREGQPSADFFGCVAFGKQAEFVEKYIKKGTKVVLSGALQNDNYKDKDGNDKTVTKIYVDDIEFAESKASSGNTSASTPAAATSNDGFINVPDDLGDELPFT